MIVLKFGGTSVANAENISKVKHIVASQGKPCIVVVSALGGLTDVLLNSAYKAAKGENYEELVQQVEQRHLEVVRQLIPTEQQAELIDKELLPKFERLRGILSGIKQLNEISEKSTALISSLGEVLSSFLINQVFQAAGLDSQHVDSRQVIKTDKNYLKAKVDFEQTNKNFQAIVNSGKAITVMGGFIASDTEDRTTTLGRGGSDYTASIAAAAVNAEELQIWTDVSGMLSADPRLVKQAEQLPHVSYEEAMELSHFGAKVIYPPTIIPAKEKQIPIYIKNTFEPEHPGTKIHGDVPKNEATIRGISSIKDVSLVSVIGSGMIGIPGFSYRMFRALSIAEVNVILITQASSEHSITVAISAGDKEKAVKALEREFKIEIADNAIDHIRIDENMAILSVVGNNMRHQIGLSGRIFSTLGKNGVNIISLAQGSTERNISTVIEQKDLSKAINVLHEAFFEDSETTLNLFVMGVGLVGSELLDQIKKQNEHLKQNSHINIRVVGLSNSRKMILAEQGIDLDNYKTLLAESTIDANHQQFIDTIKSLNLSNSIFVDNTASKEVADLYTPLANENISIVTCNKIAAAAPLADYLALKKATKNNRTSFFFETNVGASLPIISTMQDMILSGDKIEKVEAILSGSLNYIFNAYDGSKPFVEVVKDAQQLGFTEPDPRIDLSGLDVKRKILILSRVAGHLLDQQDVKTVDFLPESTKQAASVDEFFEALAKEEAYFKMLYDQAKARGANLKVVASFDASTQQASVELKQVLPSSPYFDLGGKDNIVLITSKRYTEPLIVRGAGAGACVTASGVFGDILKVARS